MIRRLHLLSSSDARSAIREGAQLCPTASPTTRCRFTSRLISSAVSNPCFRVYSFHPTILRTARLATLGAWAVVCLPRTRSTTNFHGPLNRPKNPQCCRRPHARKRHLTQRAGSPEQASSLTPHEHPRPHPNLPTITPLLPQNTLTVLLPPLEPTTRRHTAMTLEILVLVHLGIQNPNRPSPRHQRVHFISSPRPCHPPSPSVCHTLVGYHRSAGPRILPFAKHPKPGKRIGTRTPVEVANETDRLIHTRGRPLGKSAEIQMTRGSRSITPPPSVGTSKNGQMRMLHYRSPPAIAVISLKTIQ